MGTLSPLMSLGLPKFQTPLFWPSIHAFSPCSALSILGAPICPCPYTV